MDQTLENHMQVQQIRMRICICVIVFVYLYFCICVLVFVYLYLCICTTHSLGPSGLLDQTLENHMPVSQIRLILVSPKTWEN